MIAPHNIKVNHISSLQAAITKKSVLYSDVASEKVSEAEVLIIDTIGLLTKIYSYADMAYVGGGFSTGLHNTLEPAVFGIPVLIGPHYEGFYEAKELVSQKGIISISNQ
ncbi:MAG: 3-deoxy-D-manno-octulosonic acid transferase [Croceivirga sp.]